MLVILFNIFIWEVKIIILNIVFEEYQQYSVIDYKKLIYIFWYLQENILNFLNILILKSKDYAI